MERDPRYQSVKASIEKGYLTEFTQIFDVIPKTTLTQHLKISNYRMASILENVDRITMTEIYAISNLFDIDYLTVVTLFHNEYLKKRGNKKPDRSTRTK